MTQFRRDYRIVIRAFTARRDVGWAALVKGLLERMGCTVEIASCRNFARLVKYWRPHGILVNTHNSKLLAWCKDAVPSSRLFLWPGEAPTTGFEQSFVRHISKNNPHDMDKLDLILKRLERLEKQIQDLRKKIDK